MKKRIVLLGLIAFLTSCSLDNINRKLYPNIYWAIDNNIKINELVIYDNDWDKVAKFFNKEKMIALYFYSGGKHYVFYKRGYQNDWCIKNHEIGHIIEDLNNLPVHSSKYTESCY